MDADTYRQESAKLFQDWKNKKPSTDMESADQPFVTDGVIDPDIWFRQEVRPLFLLKEAYGGEKDWDLFKDHCLNTSKQNVESIGKTWVRIYDWTRGLLGTTSNGICSYARADDAEHYDNEYLHKAAVINIKKRSGGTLSDMNTISRYAEYDKENLKKEIELADPTVIVCGYTISCFNTIWGETIRDIKHTNPNGYYFIRMNGHHVIVIDFYHPANQYPDTVCYFGLMGIYQQALLNYQLHL